MEKFSFKIEFADNGVVITNNNKDFVNVYEENEHGILLNIRKELSVTL